MLLTDVTDADAVAARIVAELSAPYRFDGKELQPTVSVGFAANAGKLLKASDLLRRAGIATYVAKAAGKNRSAPPIWCPLWTLFLQQRAVG